jgi:hypothetical protein
MGRHERRDIDYFPFYIKDGRTLFVLENKYQCKGSGFFTNLFRFLSRTPDHHFCIESPGDKLYFFASVKCDETSGMDMIKMMVETGKLDRDLWEQKAVLASQDFLNSIQDAYRKRTNDCITIDEIKAKFGITSGRNPHTSVKLPEEIHIQTKNFRKTSGSYTQSKVKKSKEKKKIYKRKKFIPPSKDDVIKYFEEKGYLKSVAETFFEYYDTAKWQDSTGKPVKNWKQKAIAVWFKEENKDAKAAFLRRHGVAE